MKVLKTIFNTIINILIVLVLIVSILIAVFALTSKASGISTLFGYTVQTIQSDSMKGTSPDGYKGGDFEHGDIIIGKATNFALDAEYEVGDIVTFLTQDSEGNDVLIVHRIVEKTKDDSGSFRYQTWGDNREVSTIPDQEDKADFLSAGNIASVFYSNDYQGSVIKGLGNILDFIQTQLGFFLIVLLPMIAFFLYELIRVVLNFSGYKKAKIEEQKEESEADKQAAIDAAVAEALRKREEQDHTVSAPVEIPEKSDHSSDFPQMTADEYEEFKKFQEFKKMQENDNSQ